MLDNNKITLMTKLAVYEEKEGKEDIRLSRYFRMDFIRFEVIKSIVSVTVAYLCILVVIALYKSEYLIQEAVKLDYKWIGSRVLGIYIILLTVYVFLTIAISAFHFDSSRKRLFQYKRKLKKLHQFYVDEENGQK